MYGSGVAYIGQVIIVSGDINNVIIVELALLTPV